MIYVDKDGDEHLFRRSIVVYHTLTLVTYSQHSLPIMSLVKIVWKHAGYNCLEMKYRSYFKRPDGGQSYSFDLFFRVGGKLPYSGRKDLNQLMWEIEQEACEKLDCVLMDHTHNPNADVERKENGAADQASASK